MGFFSGNWLGIEPMRMVKQKLHEELGFYQDL